MRALKVASIAIAAFLMIAVFLSNSYRDLIDPYYWDGPMTEEATSNGYQLMQRHRGGAYSIRGRGFTRLPLTSPSRSRNQ